MNIRETTEDHERRTLSEFAVCSADSRGRGAAEAKCDVRTDFQRDRDRINHSKSFRRLMHKTQVFISPEGDHYRTRLTHTLEVSQIARTIARGLRLNEDLTEAIALGHDLGHTPFGHTGEDAIDKIMADSGGFCHNEQSVRVVCVLEKNGDGLNLTEEVIDGIKNHRSGGNPSTMEGKVVQLSDKIAYINHDIDDAIRARLITPEDLPKTSVALLGGSVSSRIGFLVRNAIENSAGKNTVLLSADAYGELHALRRFMFDGVYENQLQIRERAKIRNMFAALFTYYVENPEKLPEFYRRLAEKSGESPERVAVDYIAGMTDRFCQNQYMDIFMPSSWQ